MNHHHFELLTCYDDQGKRYCGTSLYEGAMYQVLLVVDYCYQVRSLGQLVVEQYNNNNISQKIICMIVLLVFTSLQNQEELHTVEVWMKCIKSEKSMFFMAALFVRLKVVGLILQRVRHEFFKHARKTQQEEGSVIHDPFRIILKKIYFQFQLQIQTLYYETILLELQTRLVIENGKTVDVDDQYSRLLQYWYVR